MKTDLQIETIRHKIYLITLDIRKLSISKRGKRIISPFVLNDSNFVHLLPDDIDMEDSFVQMDNGSWFFMDYPLAVGKGIDPEPRIVLNDSKLQKDIKLLSALSFSQLVMNQENVIELLYTGSLFYCASVDWQVQKENGEIIKYSNFEVMKEFNTDQFSFIHLRDYLVQRYKDLTVCKKEGSFVVDYSPLMKVVGSKCDVVTPTVLMSPNNSFMEEEESPVEEDQSYEENDFEDEYGYEEKLDHIREVHEVEGEEDLYEIDNSWDWEERVYRKDTDDLVQEANFFEPDGIYDIMEKSVGEVLESKENESEEIKEEEWHQVAFNRSKIRDDFYFFDVMDEAPVKKLVNSGFDELIYVHHTLSDLVWGRLQQGFKMYESLTLNVHFTIERDDLEGSETIKVHEIHPMDEIELDTERMTYFHLLALVKDVPSIIEKGEKINEHEVAFEEELDKLDEPPLGIDKPVRYQICPNITYFYRKEIPFRMDKYPEKARHGVIMTSEIAIHMTYRVQFLKGDDISYMDQFT